MKSDVVHSRGSDEWETPQDLFDTLHSEFRFTLDPCATKENKKCSDFFSIENSGLTKRWHLNRTFVNPPYSKIKDWVKKCREESDAGALVVMLIPSRTDTRYWHEHIIGRAEVRFIKGRLKFSGSKNSAPFPSAVVIFRPPQWLGGS